MQVQVDREIPQHIVDTIAKDGYHLEVVSPENSDEPYVFYTVGRTAQKKPEVIFFDYRKDVGETLIKEYVTRQIDAIVPNWQAGHVYRSRELIIKESGEKTRVRARRLTVESSVRVLDHIAHHTKAMYQIADFVMLEISDGKNLLPGQEGYNGLQVNL